VTPDTHVQGYLPEPWKVRGWRALARPERVARMLAYLARVAGRAVVVIGLLAACARIEVDCAKGTARVKGGFDTNAQMASAQAAAILAQCPRATQ